MPEYELQQVKDEKKAANGAASVTSVDDHSTSDGVNGDAAADNKFGLQRTMGLAGSISINLGTMIGSGIFVSPKGVLTYSGSVGQSLCIWAFTGVVAMLGGLCYAELGTLIGKSAGEFVYLQQAYGDALAYMFQFVTIFVIRPGSQAITSMTCSQYALALFFDDGCGGPPGWIVKLLAIAIIWLIVYINCKSATAGQSVQIIFTVAKVSALIIIILGGVVKLCQGYTENLENAFEGSNFDFVSVVLAFYSAYWAYDGWQMANVVAEEIKNPKRNVPIAVLTSVIAATVLYVFTNISYFSVLSAEDLLASDTVAISWAQLVIPNFVWIMPIAVAMSTFGGVNGSIFVGGRLVYRAGREGHLPSIFSYVHVNFLTPFPAIVLGAIMTTIYILPADIQLLLDMLGFILWTINGFVFASLIIFRYKKPDSDPRYKRAFKCPIIIAFLMTALSIFFVFLPIVIEPEFYYFYGIIVFIGCLVFYFPFVHFGKSIPGTSTVTRALQLFFKSAPSEIHVE